MDVYSTIDGQHFVWDHDKAAENILRHRISFDTAREAFLDPDCVHEDASPQWEAPRPVSGKTGIIECSTSSMCNGNMTCFASSPRGPRTPQKGYVMKMSDRIKRNMQRDQPTTTVPLRLRTHVLDDLNEVAAAFDFTNWETLIRAYISRGLRDHLAQIEARRSEEAAVEEFSRRLLAHGVPEEAIQEAAAEMKAAR